MTVGAAAAAGDFDATRQAWEALAASGNPFVQLNADRHARPLGPFTPPPVRTAWDFRSAAEELVGEAWAAADPASPHRGRTDLVAHAVARTDWLVDAMSPEGWWWRDASRDGDPNVNRFVLAPLLDAVRWLRGTPDGERAWTRWRARLDAAVDLQRRAYRGEVAWDWGGRLGGRFPNQDAYHALTLALSADLFDRPADRVAASAMVARIRERLLPDGGIAYLGDENDSPEYHALTLLVLGRYATLTGDPVAREVLRRTSPYWGLVASDEGQPEYWSDVWWKQPWKYLPVEGWVVAAGATAAPRDRWVLWRVLERTAPRDRSMHGVYAAPYWTGARPDGPSPRHWVARDENMRGIRGRDAAWYFGVAQGHGLRGTFVGAMLTDPTAPAPLRAALRGVSLRVLGEDAGAAGLGLSGLDDRGALALQPDRAGALAVRHGLYPDVINNDRARWKLAASPWQVTELWRAAADGIVGTLVLEAARSSRAETITGRIALGPGPVTALPDGTWSSAGLRVAVLDGFGTAAVETMTTPRLPADGSWQGIAVRRALDGPVAAGSRWLLAVWIAPPGGARPGRLTPLPDGTGWAVERADGGSVGAVWNPAADARSITLPWPHPRASAWVGAAGERRELDATGGTVVVPLGANECALLES